MSSPSEFKTGERIVYPSDEVGETINVDNQIVQALILKFN